MCTRHSFILTRTGKVLDGLGMTDSHTEIREFHGLKHTDDSVNAYEWQPPKGWPAADWEDGLTKDTEVFTPKSSHLDGMGRHLKRLYPTMAEWDAGDTIRITEDQRSDGGKLIANSELITVPQVTLPNGQVIPSFQTFKYPASRAENIVPVSDPLEAPWVNVSYNQARAIAVCFGLELLRETQALAIAFDISQQDINWTGGKVGEGSIYQGLHKGTVRNAQPGTYESRDPEERRWHQLSNGERIYDFSGNCYSWIFDDVQGDENGIVGKKFSRDSPSIAIAPYPSMTKGIGWRPDPGADWSGDALIRGGFWLSRAYAGVFSLVGDVPGGRDGGVGFRCTK